MSGFAEFLHKLGNLHDCRINSFDWQSSKNIVRFDIEDFYSNFEGLPEYIGVTPGHILLHGVRHVDISISAYDGTLKIQDFLLQDRANNSPEAIIYLWPSGVIRVAFCNAAFPNFPLP
jgi:hypothetical protein